MTIHSKPNRREFVKGSAAAAAAALAGGLTMARRVHAAGGDRIKIALIGCGGRGTGAASQCLSVPNENIRLIAVADAFEDRATRSLATLKGKFGDKVDVPPDRVFTGFDAYRQAIDCEADLVLLVTPPGFRPMQYKAAIEAGRRVFMEKPVCVDAPGFRSVMETNKLADEKGLQVAVGLNSRHTAPVVETVRRIHDGAVGALQFTRAYCNNAGVWVRPRQPGQTEMEYQMRNWFYFVWLCGDHIVEQHVHLIDQANWIKDDHPVEANGMGGREVRKGKDHGQIFDHHFNE
ncbi:MAG: Gfo/Idh/MocA family oxidoreductase, partial [Planctomycetes bacterium]|nr:Gfo/Idh/MocA family oxidoreductase [Planctomycetota bacterium]